MGNCGKSWPNGSLAISTVLVQNKLGSTMSCEKCAEYERQLRDIALELCEAQNALRNHDLTQTDKVLVERQVSDLRTQIDAPWIAFGLHRRGRKCGRSHKPSEPSGTPA